MKQLIILFALFSFAKIGLAQDFAKDMASTNAAYNAGKLEETHFALHQAMQEIDIIIGNVVL